MVLDPKILARDRAVRDFMRREQKRRAQNFAYHVAKNVVGLMVIATAVVLWLWH